MTRGVAAWLTCLCLALVGAGGVRASCYVAEDRVENEIVVELSPTASIDTLLARYAVQPIDSIAPYRMWLLAVAPGADVDAIVASMSNDPEILRAEPHRHLESPEGVQRSIGSLDFTADPNIFRTQPATAIVRAAAAQARYSGDGVTVAVLDTAQSLHHAETEFVQWVDGVDALEGLATADVPANGLDDDGDGLIDESDQHGTHVAGLVHLAAPGARILAIRVLEADGKGQAFAVARGILAALDRNVDVINLSLSMSHDSRAVERAIEDATDRGVVVVTAAGNRGLACVEFPASQGEPIAVAAVTDALTKTSWSNQGAEVTLSAPGEGMLSTWGTDLWARWSGTSFATPLVSGGVALLLEKYPGLTPAQVREVLRATAQADANPPAMTGQMGAGVLDLDALTLVLTLDRTSMRARRDGARWSPVAGASHYDVVRGDVASLSASATDVDLGTVTCLGDDRTATDVADPDVPDPGQVFFYLFRDDAPDTGGGSYGNDGRGHRRSASAGDCAR